MKSNGSENHVIFPFLFYGASSHMIHHQVAVFTGFLRSLLNSIQYRTGIKRIEQAARIRIFCCRYPLLLHLKRCIHETQLATSLMISRINTKLHFQSSTVHYN
ncbi:hypothetical protein GJ496_009920 [Pomphorhynchus laevis]|nr:hypothetical protein GJ496_009920 [Pomphorhynchus laevis]